MDSTAWGAVECDCCDIDSGLHQQLHEWLLNICTSKEGGSERYRESERGERERDWDVDGWMDRFPASTSTVRQTGGSAR